MACTITSTVTVPQNKERNQEQSEFPKRQIDELTNMSTNQPYFSLTRSTRTHRPRPYDNVESIAWRQEEKTPHPDPMRRASPTRHEIHHKGGHYVEREAQYRSGVPPLRGTSAIRTLHRRCVAVLAVSSSNSFVVNSGNEVDDTFSRFGVAYVQEMRQRHGRASEAASTYRRFSYIVGGRSRSHCTEDQLRQEC